MKNIVITTLIITTLVSTAISIHLKISNDIQWQKVSDAEWERDLKNMMISKGTYWNNSKDDCRIEIANNEAEKCRWINYVLAQEKYYRGK